MSLSKEPFKRTTGADLTDLAPVTPYYNRALSLP